MKYTILLAILLSLSGCSSKQENVQKETELIKKEEVKENKEVEKKDVITNQNDTSYKTLDGAILAISKQLLKNIDPSSKDKKIILTTFVDLKTFKNHSPLGNIISESMFNELYSQGIKIIDFRGQDAVSVNKNGEFLLTRDAEKLKDEIEQVELVLVGTYTKFENESLLINARIIDSMTGDIFSTARVVFEPTDCKTYDVCKKEESIVEVITPKEPLSPISIVSDK